MLVNETMCFRFLLSCILEKKEVSEVVYEYTTNTSCDLDLSLHALKIQNGMSFKIY